jgi:signal transduction histidine kinase
MAKRIRLSLANKCQLLFGVGVVLILVAALVVVSKRMDALVEHGPMQRARDIASLWLTRQARFDGPALTLQAGMPQRPDAAGLAIGVVELEVAPDDGEADGQAASADAFLAAAVSLFENVPDQTEYFDKAEDDAGRTYYRYARAVRTSDLISPEAEVEPDAPLATETPLAADPLEQVILVNVVDEQAARQRVVNQLYLLAAGLFAGLLAIASFWFITSRLVLSPVRVLRGFAEKVSQGDLNIRSDINTGDEFEQLSDMFNAMLDNVRSTQDQLKSANKSLDLKLGELAESNLSLHEANKVKGEFLANVSHELRTPLNSIIGFAEVLQETLADRTGPVDEKRKRYAANIINSSRRLLELINDLLDLAKIEAGRMEVRLATVSIQDTAEGLANLIRPQAEQRSVQVRVRVQPNLPPAETDPGKLQQVLFNFLANAVKFSPPDSSVVLAAALENAGQSGGQARLRLSVTDQGPGIAPEDHDKVFEKFSQLDPTVTREHGGTGLGLTISKELAEMLGGQIELDSDTGRGATFALVIPLIYQPPSAPLMPAGMSF